MLLPDDYSGMPRGLCYVDVSVFQICSSLLKKGGMLNLPDNLQFWQIAQPLLFPNHGNGVRDFKWKWWHGTKAKHDADATSTPTRKKGKKQKSFQKIKSKH